MKAISTTARLSLSISLITVSILFASEMFGFLPNRAMEEIKTRTLISEALAVQVSALASRNDREMIDYVLEEFVSRNEMVVSAALVGPLGRVLASFGESANRSADSPESAAAPGQITVPIYRNSKLWGTVEVTFAASAPESLFSGLSNSSFSLFAFVGLAAFGAYFLFLKRSLSELSPSKVIPDRVRAAFDVLTEGVLILDSQGRIVLGNKSFSDKLGIDPSRLVGLEAAKLPLASKIEGDDSPWTAALEKGETRNGVVMEMTNRRGLAFTFAVNAAPILDADKRPRGVLATFDDLSQVERHNYRLNKALNQLESTKLQITEKNRELEALAMRDALTGCHNRRYLFESFEKVFAEPPANRGNLTCFMIDIDHFKRINDRYGHSVGDEVISKVGEVLRANSRTEDVVARYGGEEFCMIGRGLSSRQENEIAERLRRAISTLGGSESAPFPLMRITASIGYVTCTPHHETPMQLVEHADQALYQSKEAGRNRATRYIPDNDQMHTIQSDEKAKVVWLKNREAEDSREEKAADDGFGAGETDQVIALQDRVRELEELALKRADEIWRKSLFDDLTQLPNRILLLDRADQDIKRIPRYGKILAAVSLEIETVQRVKDALGLESADNLLKEVAGRLSDVVRFSDTLGIMSSPNSSTLARIGNNEFVILLGGIYSPEAVSQVLRRTVEALAEPFTVDSEEVYVSGNLGVGLYPNDADSAESLIKCASSARVHAQHKGGRLNVAYYSEEMNQATTRRIRIEGLLHQALKTNQFAVYYQPQVDIETGLYSGMEALIRWRNTPLGDIPPSEFIPIAEEVGLMPEVSAYMLRSVCRQLKLWEPLGLENLRVAVNLSPVELRDPDVATRFLDVLAEESVPPGWLEVEITESAVIDNMATAVAALKQLEEAGVEIAIDDFGTGYSSLSHLTLLPLHVLKIDGSFVRDIEVNPNSQAIVKAIIAMARTAGLRILAEGVETDAEVAWLRRAGCEELQGYYYSRPVAGSTMTALLIDNNERTPSVREDEKGPLWRRLMRRRTA